MFKRNGKLKLMIIVGTRPEIIRLSAVINKCREYFDTLLVHTGQNYDYTLNGIFFSDLKIADPDVYLNAVGKDLGETMGNIIAKSYELMAETKPDAVLVLGDTNSSCRSSAQSAFIYRYSTWKPETDARMNVCLRKRTGASSILFPTSISHTRSTPADILPSADFPKSARM